MDYSEIGILTQEQVNKLNKLLVTNARYKIKNLHELLAYEIKYFIQSKEHLFKIYNFRLENTRKADLKEDLGWLVNNIKAFEGNSMRVSFIGSQNDRIIIFSDTDISILVGVICKGNSMAVERIYGHDQ